MACVVDAIRSFVAIHVGHWRSPTLRRIEFEQRRIVVDAEVPRQELIAEKISRLWKGSSSLCAKTGALRH